MMISIENESVMSYITNWKMYDKNLRINQFHQVILHLLKKYNKMSD